MKNIDFFFSTKITFDNYVHSHSFALRTVPIESPMQHIVSCELNISPFVSTKRTVDAFGNNVTTGYVRGDHRFLDFDIRGRSSVDLSKAKTDYMPCYAFQSEFTKPDDGLKAFYAEISADCRESAPVARAAYFSDRLSDVVSYVAGVTTTSTVAAEAFALKKGVCQDYSHIMLSLLRMDSIPCRYIAGLAYCDGETHSWIEVWDGVKWVGLDPANNCPINEDYIILSQGRDFGDCSIDRGVMFGEYTRQLQLISSRLSTAY